MRKVLSFGCVINALFLVSCATTSNSIGSMTDKPPIHGLVYDYDNVPVSSAVIGINEKKVAVSDVNGRFYLAGLAPDSYSVSVEREGYEAKSVKLDYTNSNQILYIKIFSAEQLLTLAEKALEKRNWGAMESYLERAEQIRPEDVSTRYLRAVLYLKKGDAKSARAELEHLISGGVNDPFIHLFLADILQFRLDEAEEAISHLDRFLESRYDPDIEKRRAELALLLKKEPGIIRQ